MDPALAALALAALPALFGAVNLLLLARAWGAPPAGAHSTSREDGPWRGSKKHGARRSGGSRPSRRAMAELIAQRPSSSAMETGSSSCGLEAAFHDRSARS